MDIQAHRWFERLRKSYAEKFAIGLWQGSDIVAELAHRKAICELFFPDAALNVSDLRALVMRTAAATEAQLADLAQETAEQLIERLKKRDARFNYQLVVTPEDGLVPSPGSAQAHYPSPAVGATFSISVGHVTVNAFARDVEALKLDPPCDYADFFRNTTRICDHFDVDLQLNRPITQSDAEGLAILKGLMDGKIAGLGPITGSVTKTCSDDATRDILWDGNVHKLRVHHEGLSIAVLDTSVETGPFAFLIDVRLTNRDILRQKWDSAAEGTAIDLTWEPLGPGEVVR